MQGPLVLRLWLLERVRLRLVRVSPLSVMLPFFMRSLKGSEVILSLHSSSTPFKTAQRPSCWPLSTSRAYKSFAGVIAGGRMSMQNSVTDNFPCMQARHPLPGLGQVDSI